MAKDQAAVKLMRELQKGFDSGKIQGWIPEDEAVRLLDVDFDNADRKLFDATMSAHLTIPITYSLGEVYRMLDP